MLPLVGCCWSSEGPQAAEPSETPRVEEPLAAAHPEPFVGFSPDYTVHHPNGTVEERTSTYEEVLDEAKAAAREHGRRWPLRGVLILKDKTSGKPDVVVDPLTLDNLRASGVRMETVEMVFLVGEREAAR